MKSRKTTTRRARVRSGRLLAPDLLQVSRDAGDHFDRTQSQPHSHFSVQTDTLSIHASKRFWFCLGAEWQASRANSAICREGVQCTLHPKMARKLADYRRRQTRRAKA
jgi:hypothetical protein